MHRDKVISLLAAAGILNKETVISRGQQINISCPLAQWTHKKKVDVHPSCTVRCSLDKETIYYCFSCKDCGPLWMLFDTLRSFTGDNKFRKLALEAFLEDNGDGNVNVERVFSLREAEPLQACANGLSTWFYGLDVGRPEVVEYIKSRGVIEDAVRCFNLRWDSVEKRVVFPMYTFDGEFHGAVGRSVVKDAFIRYRMYGGSKAHLGYGFPYFSEHFSKIKYVLLMEGFIDEVKTWSNLVQLGLDSVYFPLCAYTSSLSDEQCNALSLFYKPVIGLWDDDPAGRGARVKSLTKLSRKVPNYRDVLLGKKDPGELCPEELEKLLKEIG